MQSIAYALFNLCACITSVQVPFGLRAMKGGAKCKGKWSSSLQPAIPLQELTFHMGSHSVTCHLAEVTLPPLPQPIKACT